MCTEIAIEYENRQRDHSYTQEQVIEKCNNTKIKSCHICKEEKEDYNFDHDHVTGNKRGFTNTECNKNF